MRARRSRRGVGDHSSWVRVPVQGSVKVVFAAIATRSVEEDSERDGEGAKGGLLAGSQ